VVEDLWRVVGDATRDAKERAVAAVSLGPTLDDEGRTRLRVVANTTAAPRLRVAIESVVEPDDERLERALAEVASEGSAQGRRGTTA
jgi:hypothetical protein